LVNIESRRRVTDEATQEQLTDGITFIAWVRSRFARTRQPVRVPFQGHLLCGVVDFSADLEPPITTSFEGRYQAQAEERQCGS
jgi:hypothetical protein